MVLLIKTCVASMMLEIDSDSNDQQLFGAAVLVNSLSAYIQTVE